MERLRASQKTRGVRGQAGGAASTAELLFCRIADLRSARTSPDLFRRCSFRTSAPGRPEALSRSRGSRTEVLRYGVPQTSVCRIAGFPACLGGELAAVRERSCRPESLRYSRTGVLRYGVPQTSVCCIAGFPACLGGELAAV